MPLPVGQIAVFTAIAIPYVIILTVLGLPFNHTSFWLYVLPPGVLAWLATRPVLESKRLPELIVSQVRYLGEPRTWCRLAPLAEKDEVLVVARVWCRAAEAPAELAARRAAGPAGRRILAAPKRVVTATARLAAAEPAWPAAAAVRPATGAHARPAAIEQQRAPAAAGAWAPARIPAAGPAPAAGRVQAAGHAQAAGPQRPAQAAGRVPAAAPPTAAHLPVIPAAAVGQPLPQPPAARSPAAARPPAAGIRPAVDAPVARSPAADVPPARPPAAGVPVARSPAADVPPARPPAAAAPAASPPHVTVTGDRPDGRPLRVVERALRGPADSRGDGWHDRVVVVPGGHRPGRPDFQQRDRPRAQLPVPGCRRLVVLGCTVGAGPTMTALLTGEVLASLRDEQIAVLDLNPGTGSLAQRARA